jgi:hypothetical protein
MGSIKKEGHWTLRRKAEIELDNLLKGEKMFDIEILSS